MGFQSLLSWIGRVNAGPPATGVVDARVSILVVVDWSLNVDVQSVVGSS